ncbi:hypothetical protein JAAARDRAFT_56234 [Jaapia argillacea MUCL 33604]|uniref:MATE efflux family protein n=1 Tax=Jaapia argillacea MUCL 33604 TaxID=933084 RepID=A0A067Q9W9_9AGAM|nr:hypothetical protein JAAARDRAFT_56234 [Jaapia argillacea MUCL 33604]
MSSTYVHYSAPSSLPSDYAILARYAHARQIDEEDEENEVRGEEGTEDDAGPSDSVVTRRTSFPTLYIHRFAQSTSPTRPYVPTENTPLLNPLVPRIEEDGDNQPNDEHLTPLAKYMQEARVLIKYTLPVFGSHVFEYSLVVASVVSIGHLSTNALAASTLGSMTASVTGFSIIQGFACTLDTMLPSAWTSSQPHLVGLWSQRMGVVMAATLIPIYVVWFNSEAILLLLKQEPEVAHLASVYLKYISIGLPAYAFNSISRRYFQSQGLFTVPTRVIIAVAPINALLNYLLVWGPEPFRLGFIGAPIATAISFNLIALISIIYGVFFIPKTAWYPFSRRMFTSLGVLVQLGLAGVGQVATEWWSWELIGRNLGPVTLAAQSVLLVSGSVTYQAPFALSVATSVRVGNLLGEQNAKRAAVAAQTSLLLSLLLSGVSSAVFLVFKDSWGHLFNDDPDVVSLVASILPLVALFQVFDGLSAVTSGIFRARGKQFTSALLNLSAYYVIGIPFGLWLTFKHNMALHGLWIGLTVSLVYCAAFGVYLSLRTDWNREVTKVMDRLAAESKSERIHSESHV